MRLIVDALAAQYGGLATYVQGLLTAWRVLAPADELTILLTKPYADVVASIPECAQHRLIVSPHRAPGVAWRLWRTELLLPAMQTDADALLATIPTLPSMWHKPTAVVVYDLRHEERPHDFTTQQRLMRRIFYASAYRRADRLIAISHRTADALRARHPATSARVSVAHLGADHVPERRSTRDGDAIAFGHHANKDAALLLQVWASLLQTPRNPPAPRLRIIGLVDSQQAALRREATRLGVASHIHLDAYLDPATFDRAMSVASAVIFPSRYEGFGLPVLEAMRQGIPVVISPDGALQEVAGGHAATAISWEPEHIAQATRRALALTSAELERGRDHAAHFTWLRTAASTRTAVLAAIDSHSSSAMS